MAASAKHFYKGLSWLVLLNALVKPLWIFGIDRELQNVSGYIAYGSYFSLFSLSLILSFLADAGLTNLVNRQTATRQAVDLHSLLRIKAGLSAIYILLFAAIAYMTGVADWNLVWALACMQVLNSFVLFLRGMLTGHQYYRTDAWISILDKIVVIVACGIILYGSFSRTLTLVGFVWIQCIALVLSLAVIAWKMLPAQGASMKGKETFSGLLRAAAPFLLVILLMSLHGRADAFLLERIHHNGAYEAGLYASAFRLLDAGNTLGFLAASFLVPFTARHLSTPALVGKTVLQLRHALLLTAIAAVVIAAVFAIPILHLLYDVVAGGQENILILTVSVLPAYYLVHIYGSLLTATGRLRMFSLIVLGCLLVNIMLNIWLIPREGALGCCIAAIVSQYLFAALCMQAGAGSLRISLHGRSLAAYVAIGIIFYGLCLVLFVNFPIKLILLLGAAVLVLIMFAALSPLRKRIFSSI